MFPMASASGRQKTLLLLSLVLSLLLLTPPVLASWGNGNRDPNWQVSLHLNADDASIGTSYRLAGSWWLAGNLDRLGSGNAPRTSLSAWYEVPVGLFFFRFYGGGGIHTTSPDQYGFHTIIGSRFWFLFWEYEYPLNPDESTMFRNGIRLRY